MLFEEVELTYQESKKALDKYLLPIQLLSKKLQTSFDYVDGFVAADELMDKLRQISNVKNKEMTDVVRLERLISYLELFLISINELEAEDIMILYGVIFDGKSDVTLADEISSANRKISRSVLNRKKQDAYKKLWCIIEFNKLLQVV